MNTLHFHLQRQYKYELFHINFTSTHNVEVLYVLLVLSCLPLQNSLVDQGMSKEDSISIIENVTRLSGDLHHSVMMAKQFLKEVTENDCRS